jgi:hypothetical protein
VIPYIVAVAIPPGCGHGLRAERITGAVGWATERTGRRVDADTGDESSTRPTAADLSPTSRRAGVRGVDIPTYV